MRSIGVTPSDNSTAPEARATGASGSRPSGQSDLLLEVTDLYVTFPGRERPLHAVNGLSYSIGAGRSLGIIGESGSGKTISSRAVIGLLPPSAEVSGSAKFEGVELIGMSSRDLRSRRGRDFAMIFQDPARSLDPTMRIGKQITEAIRTHLPLSRREASERAVELLGLVRIPLPHRRALEYPHQLSGGMRQRVMIAIALACEPKLLIADEATTALDATTQAQIMELLAELQARMNMALIIISHDLGLAASFTDEIVEMYAGRVVERAPTRELFAHMRMPYTRALLDAIPRLEVPSHTPLPAVVGRPRSLEASVRMRV